MVDRNGAGWAAGLVLSGRPGYTAAMRRFPILVAPLALLLAFNLVACGNKGPLVRAVDVEDVDVEEAEDVEDIEQAEDDAVEGDPVDDADADADADVDADADTDEVDIDVPPPADPGTG